ncbi:LuxR C-terminal-related transcriptional regulator [Mycobacterium sp. smrl_JER01]|uniref:helix-turn-helix transcriptional regulator n=1 Tax=Mycobacterium sp. smrl_JER01 TaxID=3402633 RepID=UPI003AC9C14E
MSAPSSLLRPRDSDAVRAELRRIALLGDVPVMFGGEVHGDTLVITEYHGVRTGGLRGLAVRSNSGLGGASMVAGRPLSVADYRNASTITHDYDGPVLSEGIQSVLAVPVLVDGHARAMLYGAYRTGAPFGGRVADLVVDSARRLAEEFRIRDEVDRRLRMRDAELANSGEGGPDAEVLRAVHAELRRLAVDAPAGLQERLRALADALSGPAAEPDAVAPLTARELDVLAQVALGCTNLEAAQRLSLKTETVKSYLRSAATKLGTSSRYESVSKARRLRLLP